MYYVVSILLGLIPEVLFIVLFLTSAKQLKEKRIRLFFIISIFYFLSMLIQQYKTIYYVLFIFLLYLSLKIVYGKKSQIYTIYNVDKIQGKNNYVGRSHYDDKTIYVEKGTKEQMLLTLKHELMHVWLYENGHTNQNNDETFGYEDLCELVALSNNSINRIVDIYLKQKRLV